MGLALLVWREEFGQTPKVIPQEWVCISILRFETIKMNF